MILSIERVPCVQYNLHPNLYIIFKEIRTTRKRSLERKLPYGAYLPHMWLIHNLVWHLIKVFASLKKWTSYVTFIHALRPKILFYWAQDTRPKTYSTWSKIQGPKINSTLLYTIFTSTGVVILKLQSL